MYIMLESVYTGKRPQRKGKRLRSHKVIMDKKYNIRNFEQIMIESDHKLCTKCSQIDIHDLNITNQTQI